MATLVVLALYDIGEATRQGIGILLIFILMIYNIRCLKPRFIDIGNFICLIVVMLAGLSHREF